MTGGPRTGTHAVSEDWGYLFEEPIIRTIVVWALYWSPLVFGNYHMEVSESAGRAAPHVPPHVATPLLETPKRVD